MLILLKDTVPDGCFDFYQRILLKASQYSFYGVRVTGNESNGGIS
jgi:hypothetical protein